MRSTCLHCIINKSENFFFFLFSVFLFSASFIRVERGKWRTTGFPCAPPLQLLPLRPHSHLTILLFDLIQLPIMTNLGRFKINVMYLTDFSQLMPVGFIKTV